MKPGEYPTLREIEKHHDLALGLPGVVVPVAPGVSLAMGAGDAARLALLNTEGAA